MKKKYIVVETYYNQETDVIMEHAFSNRLEAGVELNRLAKRLLEEGWNSVKYEENVCEFERRLDNPEIDFTYRAVVEVKER